MYNFTELLDKTNKYMCTLTYRHIYRTKPSKKKRLSDQLTKQDISLEQISKWQAQISYCFKQEYIMNRDCPEYVDPHTITLDKENNIVYNSVVLNKQRNTVKNSVRFIDCLTRVHSSLFECINKQNTDIILFKELVLFNIVNKYLCVISELSTDVLHMCLLVEHIENIVKLGMFSEIISVVS